jgi:HK97 family phage portal protein
MKFLSKIRNHIHYLRKPEQHSTYNSFLHDYGWVYQKRDKQNKGVSVYYTAMKNVWINACITVKTNEILNLGWSIKNTNTDKPSSEEQYLYNLLEKPLGYNSTVNFDKLLSLICFSHMGVGDAFLEVITDDNGELIGFQYIPVDYLRYNYDNECFQLRYDPDTVFEDNQLLHIYNPPIDGTVWGISPIDILASDISLEILSRDHTRSILKHGGLNPRGVIEFDTNLDEDDYVSELERLSLQAESDKRNGTLILRGGDYKDISYSPHDLEYQALQTDIRDRILATYQVPPSKISIIETANLGSGSGTSQAENFKKILFAETSLISSEFNRIFKEFGYESELSFNELDIENKQERASIESQQLQAGVRTINEVRAGYGWEPVLWGDEPLINRPLLDVTDSTGTQSVKDSIKALHETYRWD